MLTMRRISFHAGLDLMKSSYDVKPDPALRRDLASPGRRGCETRQLVHPDKMSTEEYRTQEAALERAAATCMRKQNEEGSTD